MREFQLVTHSTEIPRDGGILMTACALVKVFRHSDGRGQILPGTLGLGGKRWEGGWDALLIDCDMCRFSWQMSAAFNWSRSNAKIGQDHCSLQGLQNPCVCSVCINEPWLRGIWELVFLSRLGHRACVSSLDHFDCCHGSRRHFWWRRDSLLGCHFVFSLEHLGKLLRKLAREIQVNYHGDYCNVKLLVALNDLSCWFSSPGWFGKFMSTSTSSQAVESSQKLFHYSGVTCLTQSSNLSNFDNLVNMLGLIWF